MYIQLKKQAAKFLCLSLFLLVSFQLFALSGRVTKVSDGDSFTLLSNGQIYKIRLHGIDCPELAQPGGKAAKAYLEKMILNKTVTVETSKRDKYRRFIGRVILQNGSNLNEQLLLAGWAWHYTKYDSNPLWTAMEREARNAGRGLWAYANPIAPWDWRKSKRRR